MSCSDAPLKTSDLVRPPLGPTSETDAQTRHDTPIISSVKYDYDPRSLLIDSDSVIGADYNPALYDEDDVVEIENNSDKVEER